ncbi:2-(1,2-epoxy-1,2-dihydrophenyl)acetyl-CoA isomerase PaaG [soil metagenome]
MSPDPTLVCSDTLARVIVRYELDEHVAVLTLDRPNVLNAFDAAMGRDALAALQQAAADPDARCIVVTGAGRAFSSGEDLAALSKTYEAGDAPDLGPTLRDKYNPIVRAIRSAPKPVVAALNGVAAGAGVGIALACDWRLAADNARLVLAFTKIGLVPDSGSLWWLTRYGGAARAWAIAASGEAIDAAKALDLGLVNEVAPASEFEGVWRAAARSFAQGPTRAYALTKSLVSFALDHSLDEQLEREVDIQTEAGRTEDHLEGVRAFLAKRRPEFKGR